jgi:alkylmercury lyase
MTNSQRIVDEAEALIPDADLRRLIQPLIRLLTDGRPVAPREVAEASGLALDRVERALAGFPDVEWADDGRIVGMGLTQRPTEHQMRIGDQTLYAWCAMDTLVFTAILDRPVTIESRDPATGAPVRVEADGRQVTSVEPQSAVVSWWVGPAGNAIRARLCNHGHFFASAETAAGWLAQRPDGSLLSMDEAYAAGSRLAAEVLGEPAAPA